LKISVVPNDPRGGVSGLQANILKFAHTVAYTSSLPKGANYGAPSSPVYAFGGHEVFPRGNLLKNS